MLELARLGVATAPGCYAGGRSTDDRDVFELEPMPVSSSEIRRARPRAASRSTASSRPAVAAVHRRRTGSTATLD